MPFAVVTLVSLEGRDITDAEKRLNENLVPMIKALPGFQSARFLRSLDGKTGAGAVTFDTEANAKAALDTMTASRPAELPPVVQSGVSEVILEI
jgi:hypothetical protein